MSTVVVTDKTINRIISKIYHQRKLASWFAVSLGNLGFDNTTVGHQALGQALFQLNIDAVNCYYQGSHEAEAFRPLGYFYRYEMTSMVQAYKSLQSFLYQCSEGDIPERPLFKFFQETVLPAFADAIISALPEYDKADWG